MPIDAAIAAKQPHCSHFGHTSRSAPTRHTGSYRLETKLPTAGLFYLQGLQFRPNILANSALSYSSMNTGLDSIKPMTPQDFWFYSPIFDFLMKF